MKERSKFCYLPLILTLFVSYYPVYAQELRDLNVVFVNEEDNKAADKSVNIAVKYIENNNYGFKVNIYKVNLVSTSSNDTMNSICSTIDLMLNKKKVHPHLILDTTLTFATSEASKFATRQLKIPTVATSFGQDGDSYIWRYDVVGSGSLIQIMPPADIISEIVRAIVVNLRIKNAAILYDPSFEMRHKCKSLLQGVPTRHVIRPLLPDIKQQVIDLRKMDIINFFILGSLESIKKVLDTACRNDYFNRKYSWFVVSHESSDMDFRCNQAIILRAKPILEEKYKKHNDFLRTKYGLSSESDVIASYYFDVAVNSFRSADEVFDGNTPFRRSSKKCGYYPKQLRTFSSSSFDVRKHLKTYINLEPSYGRFLFKGNGGTHMNFKMNFSAIAIKNWTEINMLDLGFWNASFNHVMDLKDVSFVEQFRADTVLRVVVVVQEPFINRDPSHPRGFSGYCIDLMDEIAKMYNYDYEVTEVADKSFGSIDDNGNWNGVVRELLDKRADIGLGSMSVMAERENVIDFTVPYYDLVGITILMKDMKTPTSLFKFLTVLENSVWLCILGAYCFSSSLLWLFARFSPGKREKKKIVEHKRDFTFIECLWFCMTSLTPQGGGATPENLSTRLVAGTWWLFGFIIIASYTANLAAFLTVSRMEIPIGSLNDLAKQHNIQYAPLNGSPTMTYFERMNNIENRFYKIWLDLTLNDSLSDYERAKLAVWEYPVSEKYTKMWQAMNLAGLPNSLEEAVQRVRNSPSSSEGFAYLGDATDIKFLKMTNCDLQIVGEEFSRKPYALAVQQGSVLREALNSGILQLLNERKLEHLKEKWWSHNPKAVKCEKNDDKAAEISISNIGGIFIVIFTGIAIACVCVVVDYLLHRKINPINLNLVMAPFLSTQIAVVKTIKTKPFKMPDVY